MKTIKIRKGLLACALMAVLWTPLLATAASMDKYADKPVWMDWTFSATPLSPPASAAGAAEKRNNTAAQGRALSPLSAIPSSAPLFPFPGSTARISVNLATACETK